MSDHAIFVDMSTILPDETRSIGKRLAERGLSMVDAPVGTCRLPMQLMENQLLWLEVEKVTSNA